MIVKHRQSLLDISLQVHLDISYAMDIALANNLSLTDKIEAGTELKIPEAIELRENLTQYYKNNNVVPTTYESLPKIGNRGIGYMIIGVSTSQTFEIR